MRDDTTWFSDMLAVLIELACPNAQGSSESEPFYRDMEAGIAISRSRFTAWWHRLPKEVQAIVTTRWSLWGNPHYLRITASDCEKAEIRSFSHLRTSRRS